MLTREEFQNIDEQEILAKCRELYPQYQSFQDSDDIRTIDERFAEFYLEQQLQKALQSNQDRQRKLTSIYSDKDDLGKRCRLRFQSLQQYRQQRMEAFSAMESLAIPSVPLHCHSSTVDDSLREQFLSSGCRNTLPHTVLLVYSELKNLLANLYWERACLLDRLSRLLPTSAALEAKTPILTNRVNQLHKACSRISSRLIAMRPLVAALQSPAAATTHVPLITNKGTRSVLRDSKGKGGSPSLATQHGVEAMSVPPSFTSAAAEASLLSGAPALAAAARTTLAISDLATTANSISMRYGHTAPLHLLKKRLCNIYASHQTKIAATVHTVLERSCSPIKAAWPPAQLRTEPQLLHAVKGFTTLFKGLTDIASDTQELCHTFNRQFNGYFNSTGADAIGQYPPIEFDSDGRLIRHLSEDPTALKTRLKPSTWTETQVIFDEPPAAEVAFSCLLKKVPREHRVAAEMSLLAEHDPAVPIKRWRDVGEGFVSTAVEPMHGTGFGASKASNQVTSLSVRSLGQVHSLIRYLHCRGLRQRILVILNFLEAAERLVNMSAIGACSAIEKATRNVSPVEPVSASSLDACGVELLESSLVAEPVVAEAGDAVSRSQSRGTASDAVVNRTQEIQEARSGDNYDEILQNITMHGIDIFKSNEGGSDSKYRIFCQVIDTRFSGPIVYSGALEKLHLLEERLIATGSLVMQSWRSRNPKAGDDDVDFGQIVTSLLENELSFLTTKADFVSLLLDALELCGDACAQIRLGKFITRTIHSIPVFDSAFMPSPATEILSSGNLKMPELSISQTYQDAILIINNHSDFVSSVLVRALRLECPGKRGVLDGSQPISVANSAAESPASLVRLYPRGMQYDVIAMCSSFVGPMLAVLEKAATVPDEIVSSWVHSSLRDGLLPEGNERSRRQTAALSATSSSVTATTGSQHITVQALDLVAHRIRTAVQTFVWEYLKLDWTRLCHSCEVVPVASSATTLWRDYVVDFALDDTHQLASVIPSTPSEDTALQLSAASGMKENDEKLDADLHPSNEDLDVEKASGGSIFTQGGFEFTHPVGQQQQVWANALDALIMRESFVNLIDETAILATAHATQAAVMGVTVKRLTFGPVDFESRRVFPEVDDIVPNGADLPNSLDAIAAAAESINLEPITTLAISEFDPSLLVYSVSTSEGASSLLTSASLASFRLAGLVQLSNVLLARGVTEVNSVLLDAFYWGCVGPIGREILTISGAPCYAAPGCAARPEVQLVRPSPLPQLKSVANANNQQRGETPTWRCLWSLDVSHMPDYEAPGADASPSPNSFIITRGTLQDLFVSLNVLKSMHRKALLPEVSDRMHMILSSPRSELVRRRVFDMKKYIVGEYCKSVGVAAHCLLGKAQFILAARKFAMKLARLPANLEVGMPFIQGHATDAHRPFARQDRDRSAAEGGSSSNTTTCMLSKDMRLDSAFYIPHIIQVLGLDWTPISALNAAVGTIDGDRRGARTAAKGAELGDDAVRARSAGLSTSLSGLSRTSRCLTAMSRILTSYLYILDVTSDSSVLACASVAQNSSSLADRGLEASNAVLEDRLTIFSRIQSDMRNLAHPADPTVIMELLETVLRLSYWRTALVTRNFSTSLALASNSDHDKAVYAYESLRYRAAISLPFLDVTSHSFGEGGVVASVTSPMDLASAPIRSLRGRVRHMSVYNADSWDVRVMSTADLARLLTDSVIFDSHSSYTKLKPFAYARFLKSAYVFQAENTTQEVQQQSFVSSGVASISATGHLLARAAELVRKDTQVNSLAKSGDRTFVDEHIAFTPMCQSDNRSLRSPTEAWLAALVPCQMNVSSVSSFAEEPQAVDLFIRQALDDARVISGSVSPEVLLEEHNAFGAVLLREGLRCFLLSKILVGPTHDVASLAGSVLSATIVNATYETREAARLNQLKSLIQLYEDYFARVIVQRARALHVKAAFESEEKTSSGRHRDLRRREVVSLRTETNCLLMKHQAAEILNDWQALAETGTKEKSGASCFETVLIPRFVQNILSRSMASRVEGSDEIALQVSESWLGQAIDELGAAITRMFKLEREQADSAVSSVLAQQKRVVFNLESALEAQAHAQTASTRSLQRRVEVATADSYYNLLQKVDVLTRENQLLSKMFAEHESTLRMSIRNDFEEQLQSLREENSLNMGRFADYKAKLYRDMQHSLEDIKKHAMLQVGKSDSAPLHIKRQALRIALADDELARLKDELNEAKSTIRKMRMWTQLRSIHNDAAHQHKVNKLETELATSASRHYVQVELFESKEASLRQQLSKSHAQLTQAELEIDQLRRDLQLQLKTKHQAVSKRLNASMRAPSSPSPSPAAQDLNSGVNVDKLNAELQKKIAECNRLKAQNEALVRAQAKSASSPSNAVASRSSADVNIVARLKQRVAQEQTLKRQAFARLDALRAAGGGSLDQTDQWRTKYLEVAAALQVAMSDLNTASQALVDAGIAVDLTSFSQFETLPSIVVRACIFLFFYRCAFC